MTLHQVALPCIASDYITLYNNTLHYITLHYITSHHSTLHQSLYIALHNITYRFVILHIYTCTTTKVVLTGYYDKMEMINSVDCVPFGYKKINNM